MKKYFLLKTIIITFILASLILSKEIKEIKAESVSVSGILGLWSFDESTGTIAEDSIGNNDATLVNGPTHVSSQYDNALSYDGIDDYVNIAPTSELDITEDVSVILWAKRSTFTSKSQVLFKKGGAADEGVDTPASYTMHFLPSPDNRVVGGFERADGSNAFIEGIAITDTDFHMYSYVREGDTHKLYVDGILITSSTFTGTPGATPTLPLLLGAQRKDTNDASEFFSGIIDEFQLYGRALSDTEIIAVFNQESNQVPLAVAGTSLDENNLIELNASLSTDFDGTIVAYSWLIDGEATARTGQIVSVSDLSTGEYSVELTVVDNNGAIETDTMLLGIPTGAGAPPNGDVLQEQVQTIKDYINTLSINSFKGKNDQAKEAKRVALINILNGISNLIDGEDYQTTVNELEDLAEKTDSILPPESAPDWITDDLTTTNNELLDLENLINSLLNDLSTLL